MQYICLRGYDHILFLIGVVFFLTNFLDIFKFITAFTLAHCIVLIFATFYGIKANAYLIDAVIAFSVIYKGFENLDGFKKWFSINAPNLVLMVFVFGLIHGFGLSTKLQEVAAATSIHLSLSQILCFNLGVEVGQIAVLIIVFPLLSMVRGKLFDKVSNWLLVLAGVLLLIYQLNGFFTDKGNHQHPVKEPIEHFELDHHEHSHDELPHQHHAEDSVEHHEHDHHEHSHDDGHSHSH